MAFDDDLRSRLDAAAGDPPPAGGVLVAAKEQGAAQARRRRGSRIATAAAAAVVVLVVTVALVVRTGDPEVIVGPAGDAATTWTSIPPAPGPTRGVVSSMWTGTELLVFGASVGTGGDQGLAPSGYGYDPVSNGWRTIPEPTFERVQLLQAPVWTGDRVLAIGCPLGTPRQVPQTLVFDPRNDTWGVLAEPPFPDHCADVGVWTGSELLVWDQLAQGWAFDLAKDEWRPLPDVPLEAAFQATLMGEQVFVSGTGAPTSPDGGRPLAGAIYDVSSASWTSTAPPPVLGTPVSVDDRLVLVGTASNSVYEYDVDTDSWTRVADVPLAPRYGAASAVIDGQLVLWGGGGTTPQEPGTPLVDGVDTDTDHYFRDGAVYDVAARTWTILPLGPLTARSNASAAAVDGDVVIFGGNDPCVAYLNDGARLHLGDPVAGESGFVDTAPGRCVRSGGTDPPGTIVESAATTTP